MVLLRATATGIAVVLVSIAAGCNGGSGPRSTAAAETPRQLYAQHCLGCHGPSGEGLYGPNIQGLNRSVRQITAVIASGSGRMPSFTGDLSEDRMRQVAIYVKSFKLPAKIQ